MNVFFIGIKRTLSLTVAAIVVSGVAGFLSQVSSATAQQHNPHYWHHPRLPPGAVGSRKLQRGGPLPGYFQPVEIKAPAGVQVALSKADCFEQPQDTPLRAGLLIGAVYRLKVTNIRLAEGVEVFPTIELIDRLYTPIGHEWRFAIPIDLTEEDLKLAAEGKFITRVIFVEDSGRALPVRAEKSSENWFEAAPGDDPLAVADSLGRPVAILRLGGRLPEQGPDPFFFFGSPPYITLPKMELPKHKEEGNGVQILPPPPSEEPLPSSPEAARKKNKRA